MPRPALRTITRAAAAAALAACADAAVPTAPGEHAPPSPTPGAAGLSAATPAAAAMHPGFNLVGLSRWDPASVDAFVGTVRQARPPRLYLATVTCVGGQDERLFARVREMTGALTEAGTEVVWIFHLGHHRTSAAASELACGSLQAAASALRDQVAWAGARFPNSVRTWVSVSLEDRYASPAKWQAAAELVVDAIPADQRRLIRLVRNQSPDRAVQPRVPSVRSVPVGTECHGYSTCATSFVSNDGIWSPLDRVPAGWPAGTPLGDTRAQAACWSYFVTCAGEEASGLEEVPASRTVRSYFDQVGRLPGASNVDAILFWHPAFNLFEAVADRRRNVVRYVKPAANLERRRDTDHAMAAAAVGAWVARVLELGRGA